MRSVEEWTKALVETIPALEIQYLSLLDVIGGGHSTLGKALIYNLMTNYEVLIDYERKECWISDVSCEFGDGMLVSSHYEKVEDIPLAIVYCVVGFNRYDWQ